MENQLLVILLCHLQHILRIGQKNIPSLLVFRHILGLVFPEIRQLIFVQSLNPARLVKVDRLPSAGSAILMEQPLFDNLKLQCTHRTDDFTPVELVRKKLGHTFVHQLVHTFCQLLGLHRVRILDILE